MFPTGTKSMQRLKTMDKPALFSGFLAGATFLSFVGAALTKDPKLRASWAIFAFLFFFAFYNSGS